MDRQKELKNMFRKERIKNMVEICLLVGVTLLIIISTYIIIKLK